MPASTRSVCRDGEDRTPDVLIEGALDEQPRPRSEVAAEPPHGWRGRMVVVAKRLALAGASLVLVCLLLEGLTRFVAPAPPPYRLRDGIYRSDLPLVNGRSSYHEDHPGYETREPLPAKEAGELRIAVFGESSVEGMPWGHRASPATMLYDQLVALLPERSVTVINMGRASSYTMDTFYYLLATRRYEPDVVIFYQGTNDRVDRDAELCWPVLHPRWDWFWRSLVARSHLLWSVRVRLPEFYLSATGGEGDPGAGVGGSPLCGADEAFRAWTELLVAEAASTGAHVIVTSPVQNALAPLDMSLQSALRELPPGVLLPPDDLDVRESMRCLLRRDCDFSFALGNLLSFQSGMGRQLDNRPWLLALGDAWRSAAERHGATFVDFRAQLEEVSAGGLPTTPWVADEVHLAIEGYWMLATAWTRALAEHLGGVAAGASSPSRGGDVPADVLAAYERALELDGYTKADVLRRTGMEYLHKKMPFIAAALLDEAATRFDDEASALAIGWLKREIGLEPGLTKERTTKLDHLDIARHVADHH